MFFDSPKSNFYLTPPNPDSRPTLDTFINHMMPTTYLNSLDIKSGNIDNLKMFTLQAIVDAASLLESNCTSLGTYRPQNEGSAQIINYLEPGESVVNFIDYDLMTFGMDKTTKENLRFKFLIEPSEDENLVSGVEHISASFNRGMFLNLWDGDGQFPSDSSLSFGLNLSPVNPKIDVEIKNNGSEFEVPIYTTVVPEVKKQICYSALSGMPAGSKLKVVFLNSTEGNLSGRNFSVFTEIPVGTCQDIYLAYNTGYFFELTVQTANPQAIGYLGNWSQDQYDNTGNGWVYDYKVYDANPMSLSAKLVELTYCGECPTPVPEKDKQWAIDLTWQNISPHSILVY